MILTLTIAAILYTFGLVVRLSVVTPDGGYYLAAGRGAHVPRPYALRMLAQLLPNVMAWRIVHMVSYMLLACMSHLFAERHGVNGTIVATALLALPTLRQAVSWPVLLDIPSLAWIATAAVYGADSPIVAVLMIGLGFIVHERASAWSALYLIGAVHWVLIVAALAFAGLVWLHLHEVSFSHPDEQRIDWLRQPMKTALQKHLHTLNDWRVWLLPYGASALGIVWNNPMAIVAMLFGYANCIVAQDRARVFAPAMLMLTVGACSVSGNFAIFIPIVNWFTHNTEV